MKKRILMFIIALIMTIVSLPDKMFVRAETTESTNELDAEIWNSETNSFNFNATYNMFLYLTMSGDGSSTTFSQYPLDTVVNRAELTTTNQDLFTYYGINDLAVKSSLYFTIGGLKWYPMYMSTDKNGDAILTLWLSGNQQDAWSGYSDGYKVEEGSSGVFYNGAYYSSYSTGDNYMYSTSMVRSYGLNNPSDCVYTENESGEVEYKIYNQNVNHPFALFTDSTSAFTDYIVAPRNVEWQEFQSVDKWEGDNETTGMSSQDYLSFFRSYYNAICAMLKEEYHQEIGSDFLSGWIELFFAQTMSATNDAWSNAIITEESQLEIEEMLQKYVDILIAGLEADKEVEGADVEAIQAEIDSMNAEFEDIKSTYVPYMSIDENGNHYNYYNSGGVYYEKEDNYSAWADDLLWLPSAAETGSRVGGFNGIWGSDTELIANTVEVVDGNTTDVTYSNGTLLRSSANTKNLVYNAEGTDYTMESNSDLFAIRPAFNLNLTKVMDELIKSVSAEELAATTQYVHVDELWDSENKVFNLENISTLFRYISGTDNADYDTMVSLLNASESGVYTSADMKAVTIADAKYDHQNIKVRLGGYDWHVTYLSNNKSGSPVLTLWLANSYNPKFAYDRMNIYNIGTLLSNSGLISMKDSSSGVYGNDTASVFGLNNDRKLYIGTEEAEIYVWDIDADGYANISSDTSHPFALFTASELGFTNYLTTPRDMAWQEFQTFTSAISDSSSLGNDAWSDEITEDSEGYNFTASANFATLENNSAWADDYLWLPSATEVLNFTEEGTDTTTTYLGLWETSIEQLKNHDGSTLETNLLDETITTATALRSAIVNTTNTTQYDYITISADGATWGQSDSTGNINIRPAMHINLSMLPSVSVDGLVLKSNNSTYTGGSKKDSIVFNLDGELVDSSLYTLEFYKDNTAITDIVDAGAYTIIFNGLGDLAELYTGIEFTYTVFAANISSSAQVAIADLPVDENGYATSDIVDEDGNITSYEPGVVVTYNSSTLLEGTDYTLTFSDNTAPTNKAKVTIDFMGNFKGSISKTFIIPRISLEGAKVNVEGGNAAQYETDFSTPHKYGISSVYVNGVLLVEGVDYIWYYPNEDETIKTQDVPESEFINPQVVFIIIEGMGNYDGKAYGYYSIIGVSANKVTITYEDATYTYDGTEKKPSATAVYNGETLVEGVDYDVYYYNNINASSSAYMYLSFIGNYSGTSENYYFTINPRNLSEATLTTGETEFVYDKTYHSASFSLKYNGEDISVIYYDYSTIHFMDAGTYTVTITGTDNWTGTRSFSVTVAKATIKNIDINYSVSTDKPSYNSHYYKQAEIFAQNTFTLLNLYNTEDKSTCLETITFSKTADYYKVYRDGVETDDLESVGVLTLEFTGLSTDNMEMSEESTITYTITILPDNISSATYGEAEVNYIITTYNRAEQSWAFNVTAEHSDIQPVYGEDYEIGYFKYDPVLETYSSEELSSIRDAGTYKWKLKIISSNYTLKTEITGPAYVLNKAINELCFAYYYVDAEGNFTNANGDIVAEKVYVDTTSQKYSGLPLEVDVYYSSSKTYELERETEYTVTFDDSALSTESKYVITVTGVGNYSGTNTMEFYINLYRLASMTYTHQKAYYYNYGNPVTIEQDKLSLYNPKTGANLVYGTDYELYTGEYQGASVDQYANNINAGIATMYIQGIGDYVGLKEISFTIGSLSISNSDIKDGFTLSANEIVYSPIRNIVSVNHERLNYSTDYTLEFSDNIGVGTATVVIMGKGNFTGQTSLTYTIAPKNIADTSVLLTIPFTGEYTYTGEIDSASEWFELKYEGYEIFGSDKQTTYYQNGEEINSPVEVGEYTVVIEGKNNYCGSREYTFNIVARDVLSTEITRVNFKDVYYYYSGVEAFNGTVEFNGKTLVENEDYTYTFYRNGEVSTDIISEGEVTVVVQGVNNFFGTFSHTFNIAKLAIVSFHSNNYTYKYNTEEQRPQPLYVYDNLGDIIIEDEYVLSYYIYDSQDEVYVQIDAGAMQYTTPAKYKIIATVNLSKNNYFGSCECVYEILPKPLDELLDLDELENLFQDMEFTNSDIEQDIDINFGDYGLVEGEDYEIIYGNNKETGNVTVTIVGKGNYSGSLDTSFEIVSKPVDEIEVADGVPLSDIIIEKEYTGEQVSLDIYDFTELIPYGDGYLVPDTDFTYSYADDKRVEMGDYIVTLSGLGNYSESVDITMRITSISMESTIVVWDIDDQTFTGYEIKPALVFFIDGEVIELIEGTDYTIEYQNNINVGVASIFITGMGIYGDTKEVRFEIIPVDFSTDTNISIQYTDEYVYNGSALDYSTEIKYNYDLTNNSLTPLSLVRGVDYEIAIFIDVDADRLYDSGLDTLFVGDEIINASNYILQVMGIGNYTGSKYLPFIVQKLAINDAYTAGDLLITGISPSYVFIGSAITPQVAITYKGTNVLNIEFDVICGANTYVSTGGSVEISAKELNFTGSRTFTFVIEKATIRVVVGLENTDVALYEGDALPTLKVISSDGVEGTLTYVYPNSKLELGSNLYAWTFTPNDTENYEVYQGNISIEAIEIENPVSILLIIVIFICLLLVLLLILILVIISKRRKFINKKGR